MYDDGPRQTTTTYPGGETVVRGYGTAGSIDDLLNRVFEITDGTSDLVYYSYNGTGRMVETEYEQLDLHLIYDLISDDQNYEFLDRFGRVISQLWYDITGASTADAASYGYDRVGNPKYRDIGSGLYPTDDKDQAYTYDGLHRLETMDRGTLSGSTISGTPNREQDFTLDQLGNWSTYLEKASGSTTLDQDRTHNAANEISTITESTGPTWIDPVYNAAGNMTEGPVPGDETTKHKYVYDAFNRLVTITDSSDVSQVEYEYDGMNRRIRKTDTAADPDVDYDYYYNESWQLLEVRKDQDTDPLKQHVWHDYYIDALAITWYDSDVVGASIDELYFTHDGNFNVTALVNDSGVVQERYEYETYGHPAVLDADFSDDADGVSDWEHEILFAGYQYDADAALYHVRNRVYQPSLGRWVQRDPAEYVDGGSLYEHTRSAPTARLDFSGLSTHPNPFGGRCSDDTVDEPCACKIPSQGITTPQAACAAVEANRAADPNCKLPWAEGRLICFNGRKIPCNYLTPIKEHPYYLIDTCVFTHESCHIRQTRPCPTDGICFTKFDTPRWTVPMGECACYRAEFDCLRKSLRLCTNLRCERLLAQRMQFLCGEMKATFQCANTPSMCDR